MDFGKGVEGDEKLVLVELDDGNTVQVQERLVYFLGPVRDMLKELGELPECPVPIHGVSLETFMDILKFSDLLVSNKEPSQFFPMGMGHPPPRDFLPWELEKWEIAYVTGDAVQKPLAWVDLQAHIDWDRMTALVAASHQLEFTYLLLLTCKVMANRLRGLPAEQILATLGVDPSEFTPEEEGRVRREHPWVDEPIDFEPGSNRDSFL